MLKIYISVFQLLVLIITVNGAPPTVNEKPLQLYKQTVYTAADGLPQNSIYSVTQSPDGYIWIATNIFKISPSAATNLFAGDTPHR